MSMILALLTGGATGLLGTIVSGVLKYFNTRQQQKYELQKMEMELKQISAEVAHAEKIAVIEAEAAERKAEWEGLRASYREAATRFSAGEHPALVWVDVVRGLMRPVLTLGLVILVGIVFFKAGGDVDTASLDQIIASCQELGKTGAELKDCITSKSTESAQLRIINTILYLATAAVLWWFGSRQIEKGLKR
ncbi:MAG: hypothetical protein JRC68_08890 [Deltaproteobacteria bacterium]|nr:hypothetical protein [Deltaproteobacteria bacterium]